jgi:hypothetical protein
MPAPKHLTEQQRRFAEGVATHGVMLKAAEDAGYRHAAHVGTRLLKNPRIADEVRRLREKIAKRADPSTIADAHELQSFLTRVVRGEEKDYDLTLSGDSVERAPRLETRRKAAMDLAKLLGLLAERLEHSGPGGGPIQVAPPPYREAMAGLAQLAREHPEVVAVVERATKEAS